jgi:hypothetical protein
MPRLSSIPFFYDDDLNKEQGARALPLAHAFNSGGGANSAVQILQVDLVDCSLYTLQMVWIDNSASPAPTSIMIGGTRQVIIAAPFTQGFYKVLGSPNMLDYVITNYGGVTAAGFTVNLLWLNIIPDAALLWSTQGTAGLQGTPIALSATGANASVSVTMTNAVGRRWFVTSLTLTADGSTAGQSVNATLTNLDNVGVAQTLNFSFTFPVGALVAANPVTLTFNPPLPVLLGANAVLTLPAGGAGNLNAAVTMTGFQV